MTECWIKLCAEKFQNLCAEKSRRVRWMSMKHAWQRSDMQTQFLLHNYKRSDILEKPNDCFPYS
jgi:hypothetical protein